jgi:hypothetical protein
MCVAHLLHHQLTQSCLAVIRFQRNQMIQRTNLEPSDLARKMNTLKTNKTALPLDLNQLILQHEAAHTHSLCLGLPVHSTNCACLAALANRLKAQSIS